MKEEKRTKLEKAGWVVGSAAEFLNLDAADGAFIELKLGLAHHLRYYRTARSLTQVETARMLHSSQSRVAKMEAGDPSVSLDLLVRSLLALGATPSALARTIAHASATSEEAAQYETRASRKQKP